MQFHDLGQALKQQLRCVYNQVDVVGVQFSYCGEEVTLYLKVPNGENFTFAHIVDINNDQIHWLVESGEFGIFTQGEMTDTQFVNFVMDSLTKMVYTLS